MKLTTKARYAVTALLDLVLQGGDAPIAVGEIAHRQGISVAYLERLVGQMRATGLLKSVRGAKGGYVLGRSAAAITVADVIRAVNEEVDATRCGGKGNCQRGAMCLTHYLWDELNQEIFTFLGNITLQALAEKPTIVSLVQARRDNKTVRIQHEPTAIIF